MSKRFLFLVLTSITAVACGGDDGEADGMTDGCATGPGSAVVCMCDDGTEGLSSCTNGSFGDCVCDGQTDDGDGDGDGDLGGDGDLSGDGDLGGDGPGNDDDAGAIDDGMGDDDADAGSEEPVPADDPAPAPGQLDLCENNGDCDDDMGCYGGGGEQPGYCSLSCSGDGAPAGGGTNDEPCAELTGATYTCSTTSGVCRLECEENDDSNCPDMMDCVERGGGSWRCVWQDGVDFPAGDTAAYEACDRDRECATDLVCSGTLGYCAEQCAINSHCSGGGVCQTSNNRCIKECGDGDSCDSGFTCANIELGGGETLACVID